MALTHTPTFSESGGGRIVVTCCGTEVVRRHAPTFDEINIALANHRRQADLVEREAARARAEQEMHDALVALKDLTPITREVTLTQRGIWLRDPKGADVWITDEELDNLRDEWTDQWFSSDKTRALVAVGFMDEHGDEGTELLNRWWAQVAW